MPPKRRSTNKLAPGATANFKKSGSTGEFWLEAFLQNIKSNFAQTTIGYSIGT